MKNEILLIIQKVNIDKFNPTVIDESVLCVGDSNIKFKDKHNLNKIQKKRILFQQTIGNSYKVIIIDILILKLL